MMSSDTWILHNTRLVQQNHECHDIDKIIFVNFLNCSHFINIFCWLPNDSVLLTWLFSIESNWFWKSSGHLKLEIYVAKYISYIQDDIIFMWGVPEKYKLKSNVEGAAKHYQVWYLIVIHYEIAIWQ